MNFTHTLSCLNCTRNLPHKRELVKHRPGGRKPPDLLALLVRDVDVELLPVCSRGPGAVEFGDDLDQMIAAE